MATSWLSKAINPRPTRGPGIDQKTAASVASTAALARDRRASSASTTAATRAMVAAAEPIHSVQIASIFRLATADHGITSVFLSDHTFRGGTPSIASPAL